MERFKETAMKTGNRLSGALSNVLFTCIQTIFFTVEAADYNENLVGFRDDRLSIGRRCHSRSFLTRAPGHFDPGYFLIRPISFLPERSASLNLIPGEFHSTLFDPSASLTGKIPVETKKPPTSHCQGPSIFRQTLPNHFTSF